jgi:hypothetical protein
LIELKKQELAQSAQRDQNKAQMDQARISLDQQKEQNDVSYDQARISTQQQLANERNQLTLYANATKGRTKWINQVTKKHLRPSLCLGQPKKQETSLLKKATLPTFIEKMRSTR